MRASICEECPFQKHPTDMVTTIQPYLKGEISDMVKQEVNFTCHVERARGKNLTCRGYVASSRKGCKIPLDVVLAKKIREIDAESVKAVFPYFLYDLKHGLDK